MGSGANRNIYALAAAGGDSLFAGGAFTIAGGTAANGIARWDGANWSALGTGAGPAYSPVCALALGRNGDLFAGGYFTDAGGVNANRIARWNGSNWSALGSGMNDIVLALAVGKSGDLYAGGYFNVAGGTGANYIAKWDGLSWSALGSGMDWADYVHHVATIAIASPDDLCAGGIFMRAGDKPSLNFAIWHAPTPAPVLPDIHTPFRTALLSVAPNPFNPRTVIAFELPRAARVRVAVYDVRGRLVRALLDQRSMGGRHEVVWDGRDLGGKNVPSGTYFARFDTEGVHETAAISLVR
jgi:hypothetical protein